MYLDYVAGMIGGMVGVLIGHPLDTVKVILQTRNPTNPHYQGVTSTFIHLLETHGVRSLFRGIGSPLFGLGLMNAVMFGIYGNVQKMQHDPKSIQAQTIAGAATAVGTSVVISPVELVKSRIQVGGKLAGKNSLDCLLLIYSQEGIRGIFKGLAITFVREVPSHVVYFIVFEKLTDLPSGERPSTFRYFNAGGLAGVASWVVPYPVDVIKSKIQVDGVRGVIKYKNWHDCLMKTIQNEGYLGLYRGLLPTIVRAFPVNGITFVTVMYILRNYGEKRQISHVKDTEYRRCSRW